MLSCVYTYINNKKNPTQTKVVKVCTSLTTSYCESVPVEGDFSSNLLFRFGKPVLMIASNASWLTGEKPDVYFCCRNAESLMFCTC